MIEQCLCYDHAFFKHLVTVTTSLQQPAQMHTGMPWMPCCVPAAQMNGPHCQIPQLTYAANGRTSTPKKNMPMHAALWLHSMLVNGQPQGI